MSSPKARCEICKHWYMSTSAGEFGSCCNKKLSSYIISDDNVSILFSKHFYCPVYEYDTNREETGVKT